MQIINKGIDQNIGFSKILKNQEKIEKEPKPIIKEFKKIEKEKQEDLKNLNKEMHQQIQLTKKTKLPTKNVLIQEYLSLCREKNVQPKYPIYKLEKNVVKSQIFELIQGLKNNDSDVYKIPDIIDTTSGKKSNVQLSANAKRQTGEFINDVVSFAANYVEHYSKQHPDEFLDLEGITYDLQNDKRLPKKAEAIVDRYPIIATYLNPILIYTASVLKKGTDRHIINTKLRAENPKPIPAIMGPRKISNNKSKNNISRINKTRKITPPKGKYRKEIQNIDYVATTFKPMA